MSFQVLNQYTHEDVRGTPDVPLKLTTTHLKPAFVADLIIDQRYRLSLPPLTPGMQHSIGLYEFLRGKPPS